MFYQLVENFNGILAYQTDTESEPEELKTYRNGNEEKIDKIACRLSKLVA